MMYYRMCSIMFQRYFSKNTVSLISNSSEYLILSTISTKESQNQNLKEAVQVGKLVKPLLNRPVNEVLSEIDLKRTSPTEAVTFLKALRMHKLFNNVSPENFITDSRFKMLCKIFQNSCNTLDFSLLISGLRSLLEVGISADSACVMSAETYILFNCPKISVVNLVRCLHFHHRYTKSDLQQKVVAALKENLLRKLSDISSPSEVLLLCQFLDIFSALDQKQVELKILDILPLLNVHQMCKVITSLAEKSNRNSTILNAIAFYLRQKPETLDFKEIVNILYAFKKLNYNDPNLSAHILNIALKECPNITQPSYISGLLNTCGHLKMKYTDLLDACTVWINTNFDICRTREFVAFILATASLNYSTPKTKCLIEMIIPSLTLKNIDPPVFLDVAWSLAILNNLPKNILLDCLSPKFYKPLLDVPDIQGQITNKLKLMNLKGFLKMKYPEHVFGCDLFLEPIKLKESSEIENSRRHVINVLSNFVPRDKCLCTHQSNDMGIFIDAEFIMDRNVKPLHLAEYSVTTSKLLPKGAKRIALLVLFHKDYTRKVRSLTGINALATKLLSHIGYLVIQIPYEDFLRNKTEVQKAKYLMQKITTSLQNIVKVP